MRFLHLFFILLFKNFLLIDLERDGQADRRQFVVLRTDAFTGCFRYVP